MSLNVFLSVWSSSDWSKTFRLIILELYILHLLAKCIYLKNCIAAKFCFFKMSDKSKHSDSNFYYPGKLSYAALLQLPTYSECTVRMKEVHKMVIL